MSLRKMPKAPETISVLRIMAMPIRPPRKARRYSRIWKRAIQFRGMPTLTTWPLRTSQPLLRRMMPPAPIVRSGSSRKGRTTLSRASFSRTESASTAQNRG